MPYIHPVLGVSCITTNEFWKAEADKEGVEAIDLMNDYFKEIEKSQEEDRQRLLKDKEGALEMLKDYYDLSSDDTTFQPIEVLAILDASCTYNNRKSSNSITAEIVCSDGKIRVVKYTESQYSGSYMEPPDYDFYCQIIKE